MRSERRHELGSNELLDWVMTLPDFFRQNSRTIIYIVAVLIIVAVTAYYKWYGARDRISNQYIQLTSLCEQLLNIKHATVAPGNQAVSPDVFLLIASDLDATAKDMKNETASAIASLKRAESLRAELHYRTTKPAKQAMDYQIDQAIQCYADALKKSEGNAEIEAMAKYGLGLCQEEKGIFGTAAQIYADVATDPNLSLTVAAAKARARLQTLSDDTGSVSFAQPVVMPAPKQGAAAEGLPFGPLATQEVPAEAPKPAVVAPAVKEPNSSAPKK